MRVDLGKPKSVKQDDEVIIRLRLPKSASHARISVWSKCGDFKFSPHVQFPKFEIATAEPEMMKPMYLMIIKENPVREIKFVADENLEILVRQEIDDKKEALAKVRIVRHGQTSQAIRRFFRNAIWRFRSSREKIVRQ